MFNRRNAVLGWTVWKVGKRVGKKKAKEIWFRNPRMTARITGLGALTRQAAPTMRLSVLRGSIRRTL